jgi:DNA-binding NarL/FixJ family response regulator
MGGVDTLRELRRLAPDVRAIVSSGHSNDPVMAKHRDFGFVAVAPKPYTYDELISAVDRALDPSPA